MIAISDIKVVDRHRRDLGDLNDLAASLRDLGQLQPIVVTSDLRLIAGGRRLAAARSLGWVEIDAKIARDLSGAAALLRAERDENTCRRALAPTEEHSLYEALLVLQGSAHSSPVEDGAVRDGSEAAGAAAAPGARARQSAAEIVSGAAGRHKTFDRIGEIKRILHDPGRSDKVREKAREALTEIDQTGIVAGAHKRVMLAVMAEESRGGTDLSSWSEEERTLLRDLQQGRTIVVSFREHHANLVKWAQANGYLVSVDRRTEWGNPFEMPHDGDRDTVIRNYAEHYLPHKPSLLARASELRGKALACWCAPDPCHAGILRARADK